MISASWWSTNSDDLCIVIIGRLWLDLVVSNAHILPHFKSSRQFLTAGCQSDFYLQRNKKDHYYKSSSSPSSPSSSSPPSSSPSSSYIFKNVYFLPFQARVRCLPHIKSIHASLFTSYSLLRASRSKPCLTHSPSSSFCCLYSSPTTSIFFKPLLFTPQPSYFFKPIPSHLHSNAQGVQTTLISHTQNTQKTVQF